MALYGKGESTFMFDERYQQLYLQTGDQISIFDMNTWTEIASIKNCYCYNEQTDRFFVFSYIYGKDSKPGYIKHYTLDELIDKAERYLGGQELDDITKTRYGL